MAKITIGDETAEIDLEKLGLHEAMALQKATGFRPKELGEKLKAGDADAMGAYLWLWLKRMGKDVTWEQMESGEYYIDLALIKVEIGETAGGETADPPAAAVAAAKTSS